jgi:hypothetical protein
MKHLLLAGAIALAATLGGCAEFDAAINGAVAFIDAPKTQQALSSLKSGATAFTRAVADVSAIAGEIESGVGAGQSVIGTDGKVCRLGDGLHGTGRHNRAGGGDP